jgi:hypothetical protein
VVAHIVGLPLEELALPFAGTIGVVLAAVRTLLIRR